jgi:microcystin-dependent protein
MPQRYYSSIAQPMALTNSTLSTALTILINSVAGLPASTPFTLVIDPSLSTEEAITVTAIGGLSLTVVRGEDGTAAQAHAVGAVVRHMVTGRDLRDSQEHIYGVTGVHGIDPSAHAVGTTGVQTLTGKSLSGIDNTFTAIPQSAIVGLAADQGTEAATRIAEDAAVRVAMLAAMALLVPAGTVRASAALNTTEGWLICDGGAYSRATYATLFGAIGVYYGAGDGSTTFNIPTLLGRVPVGFDPDQTEFNQMGKKGGTKTVTLTVAQMPSHTHPIVRTASASGMTVTNDSVYDGTAANRYHLADGTAGIVTTATGDGGSHPNLTPYNTVNYLIKT